MDRMQAYEKRRAELKKLSDEQLKKRFWELCEKAVQPMVELAKTHTSPSIERSVLLRMGIDSLTAKGVVERCVEMGVLGHGAGNAVLKLSQRDKTDLRAAAAKIAGDKEALKGLFGS